MIVIHLVVPGADSERWTVFGSYEGDDDRFVFGVQEFADEARAEKAASRMAEKHRADRIERG